MLVLYGVEWKWNEEEMKEQIKDNFPNAEARTHYVTRELFSTHQEAVTFGNIQSTQMEFENQVFEVVEFEYECKEEHCPLSR